MAKAAGDACQAANDGPAGANPQPLAGIPQVYPDRLPPELHRSVAAALVELPGEVGQQVLDELAGAIQAGKDVRNPIAWIRCVAARAKEGTFTPELGPAVADWRNRGGKASPSRGEPPVVGQTPEEVARSVRATQAKVAANKAMDPDLAAILLRMGEKILARDGVVPMLVGQAT